MHELGMLYGRNLHYPTSNEESRLADPIDPKSRPRPVHSGGGGQIERPGSARAARPDLLGIDRSSVFRLANTLRRRGFLANPSGRKDYILGPSIWRLSRSHDWSDMLITFSHEHLKKLAVETGETTHLAVKEGRQAFFIDHYSATRQLIMVSGQVGEFVPLYCTAHGKALLADYGVDEIKATFGAGPYQGYTPTTLTTLKQLAKECARIKATATRWTRRSTSRGSAALPLRSAIVTAPWSPRSASPPRSPAFPTSATRARDGMCAKPRRRSPRFSARKLRTRARNSANLALTLDVQRRPLIAFPHTK